jgi:ubiquinone/menaquinone biosynthesis C-methylase UbiE
MVFTATRLSNHEVLHREREFHDALAAPLEAAALPPAEPDHLERTLLGRLGPLAGQRVLELGCGTGDLTLQLLAAGARVTALDLSERMVAIARQRSETFAPGTEATFLAAPVEETGLSGGSFDLVTGKWILHHAEIKGGADEVARLLRPGGRGVFIENSNLNPLLAFGRRHLAGRFGIPRYGTEDEHPFEREDYAYYQRIFRRGSLIFPDFCCAQLMDRQLFRYRVPAISALARGLDRAVYRWTPWLRRYSYHVILDVER